jgi:hypothetical protein
VAEWSCSGLQSRVRRFDSDLSLQFNLSVPGGHRVLGSSVEELRRKIRLAHPNLTDQDVEKCLAAAMELSSGSRGVPIGKEGGARVNDARRAYDNDQASIRSMHEQINAHWDSNLAEYDRQIHGHVR